MKTSKIVWIVIIIIIIILVGWYTMSKTSPQPEVTLAVKVSSNQTLGNYLVSSNGMTLYMYTKDTANTSNCYDVCATNWPPYSSDMSDPLMAGSGATGQLTKITRTDGSSQLAYNGTPLYLWKNDMKPGDTTGQNVGGIWFVVKP